MDSLNKLGLVHLICGLFFILLVGQQQDASAEQSPRVLDLACNVQWFQNVAEEVTSPISHLELFKLRFDSHSSDNFFVINEGPFLGARGRQNDQTITIKKTGTEDGLEVFTKVDIGRYTGEYSKTVLIPVGDGTHHLFAYSGECSLGFPSKRF